jgi:tetratricopeptide (TPR) repeat protein
MRMRGAPLLLPLSVLLLTLACDGGGEEKAAVLTGRFEAAMEELDIASALQAIEELQAVLPETPESSLQLARMLARAGKLSEALWLLEEAERRYPEHSHIKIGIAETAFLVANSARALEALGAIAPEDPLHAYALLLRSRAQLKLGDLAGSLATLEQGRQLYPEQTELGIALIDALSAEGLHDRALSALRELRSNESLLDQQRSWLDLTEVAILINQGKDDDALAALDPLLAREPGNASAWQRKIQLLLRRGEAEQACALLSEALESRPDAIELHALMVTAQAARGDREAAGRARRVLMELVKGASARLALANRLYAIGQPEEALAVLEAAEPEQSRSEAAEISYLETALLLDTGKTEEAQIRFEQFERDFPADVRVEYLRARFELVEGDARAAAVRLRTVASRLDRADVQHWLGVALERSGDNQGAEYRYGMAITRNQQQVASYHGLIRTFERRRAWGQMSLVARKLISIAPDDAFAFGALARSLLAAEAAGEAEKVLRAYAKRFPALLGPVVGLSNALREQDRPADALAELDAAAARFGQDPRFLAERAIVLQLLGRTDEALASVEQAVAAGARDASLQRALAYLFFVSGRTQEAAAAVEEALRLSPDDPTPLQMLGDHLSMQHDFAGARQAYQRYLKRRPDDAAIHSRLAEALVRLGERATAIDAYRRTIELDESAVAARNNLALLLQQEGRLDEALVEAQAAYARAENEPIVMDTLGWLFLAKGLPERAVALLSKAQRLAPESLETRYHLAVAYREAGQLAEARKLLDELHENLETNHELYPKVGEALAGLR